MPLQSIFMWGHGGLHALYSKLMNVEKGFHAAILY